MLISKAGMRGGEGKKKRERNKGKNTRGEVKRRTLQGRQFFATPAKEEKEEGRRGRNGNELAVAAPCRGIRSFDET